MRQSEWKNRKRSRDEAVQLDPVALTLAVWLGLMVGVAGLLRLSENAAANAARLQQDPQRAAMTTIKPGPMLLSPYGS